MGYRWRAVLIGAAVLALTGCGKDPPDAIAPGVETEECVPSAPAGAQAVTATLQEYAIGGLKNIESGRVAIGVENVGTMTHEMVVARVEQPAALPVDSDGAVDEDQLSALVSVGEVAELEPGQSCTKVFDLPAGNYVAFCNVTNDNADGSVNSHFDHGMFSSFTVGPAVS